MKHLIKIEDLSKEKIEKIIALSFEYKKGKKSDFSSHHCALMFFENSTRTRFSFECALNTLCAHSYVFDSSKSSAQKGEEIFDTINNLSAIGMDTFIIRTREEKLFDNLLSQNFYKPLHFIDAGEGKSSHPTQALLDYMTMRENFDNLHNKNVVIVGDIKHSRVAKSNIALLNKIGANVTICAPDYFTCDIKGVKFDSNLNSAIKNADIIMCLRIQNERLDVKISKEDFIEKYQINSSNFPKNAILMHPGPVNRDVEISSELLDSIIGKTILQQAENGKYIRMAVLDMIFRGEDD